MRPGAIPDRVRHIRRRRRPVETYQPGHAVLPRGWQAAIDYRQHQYGWGTHREQDPAPRTSGTAESLEPGQTVPLVKLDGAGLVQWVKLQCEPALVKSDDLWLEATVDGEAQPAVTAPARYWFPALSSHGPAVGGAAESLQFRQRVSRRIHQHAGHAVCQGDDHFGPQRRADGPRPGGSCGVGTARCAGRHHRPPAPDRSANAAPRPIRAGRPNARAGRARRKWPASRNGLGRRPEHAGDRLAHGRRPASTRLDQAAGRGAARRLAGGREFLPRARRPARSARLARTCCSGRSTFAAS